VNPFDFGTFRHESNQGLTTSKNDQSRKDSQTLRRRTDLGFTRDRHIKYASRLQPTCSAPSRSTSSFAGSGACDVRSRDFLFRPCSAPVISAGFPGLRAVCRFLHPPPPIYRDLQGLLRRWPLPTLDLNPMARACYGDAKVTSDIRAMNHWGIVREPDPTRQAASVL
jgi:hypothetical protein